MANPAPTLAAPTLVWLRDDLRLADNPALHAAAHRDQPLAVLYILDEVSEGIRPHGSATKWWLHKSLEKLAADVADAGAQLILRRGPAAQVVPQVVDELGAGAVFWNRRYASGSREIDAALKTSLRDNGLEVQSFQANLLHEPWTVKTGDGKPFRVFTPFWKASMNLGSPRDPLPKPTTLTGAAKIPSDDLATWNLLPLPFDWSAGLAEAWTPGEEAAHARLEEFVHTGLEDYDRGRDEPAEAATSRLSPYLRFGEISPNQIWHRVVTGDLSEKAKKNSARFLSEIGWREFNWNILFHFNGLHENNFRAEFDAFPWEEPSKEHLAAWQQGKTGVPLVDAGMRELWQTGYMHNRVRMVTASFLIKNMLIDWRIGERWFWDCLVDADEANNPANWQWVAGSGADAAPYFRVFNPELQAAKFDAHRNYQRQYIPELDTPDYPAPILDLRATRAEALQAYEFVKRAGVRQ
jgi:deoxyribodipyrimidine photo-lyase